mmetsp:Transcript_16827/g.36609  ORF Transcript_16827/g.36609 Transcript_16827/m.36609 type:complete len:88 (+) Transcript_16827:85-348(+)|eukprot:CAMPEP_0118932368 /NCGR_PEP_ID=MMETSP1169-20130426/10023_1 /TAXON_ID=36882 /ORGANISM="Pyramimonas obovata, Strain CCMP722" /LENGTH=87 /DNA_ID=CAMNT_0006875017 /DNA_START=65 /DNA_END=328 /DNA_ORIENTATION=+
MSGMFSLFGRMPLFFKGTYNTEVVVGESEPAESAIRRFRRAVMQAGVIPEVRRRRYFETPQDIKKRKEANKHARNRRARQQRQNKGF